ncbi:MAG TPA: four helix bundle protein [bacterium]|nr:four helix bundle protein [bacterium]
MNQLNFHTFNSTPPPDNWQLIPLLQKTKNFYLSWYNCYKTLPKEHRYTLGSKIDNILIDLIEAISAASFLARVEKQPQIKTALRKTDTIKILLLILWETKSLDNKKYLSLSEQINEIGRMLGGWNGQLIKNSPTIR